MVCVLSRLRVCHRQSIGDGVAMMIVEVTNNGDGRAYVVERLVEPEGEVTAVHPMMPLEEANTLALRIAVQGAKTSRGEV